MLKGMFALILVVGLGLTGAAFTLVLAILMWAGQGQIVGVIEGAAQLPLLGPIIMLIVSVALMWVVLACMLELIRTTRNRKKRGVYAQG